PLQRLGAAGQRSDALLSGTHRKPHFHLVLPSTGHERGQPIALVTGRVGFQWRVLRHPQPFFEVGEAGQALLTGLLGLATGSQQPFGFGARGLGRSAELGEFALGGVADTVGLSAQRLGGGDRLLAYRLLFPRTRKLRTELAQSGVSLGAPTA